MNADGSGVWQLTSLDSSEPSWSPDGSKIAFDNWGPYTSGIYVMNADGTGIAPLTTEAPSHVDSHPSSSRPPALTLMP